MKIKIDVISIVGLFVIFLLLKIFKIVNWSWIWIFSPLWISILGLIFLILIGLVITIIKVIAQNIKAAKKQKVIPKEK